MFGFLVCVLGLLVLIPVIGVTLVVGGALAGIGTVFDAIGGIVGGVLGLILFLVVAAAVVVGTVFFGLLSFLF